jgi:hypothetical protein
MEDAMTVYQVTDDGVEAMTPEWHRGAADERDGIIALIDNTIGLDLNSKEEFTNALGLLKLNVMMRADGVF